MTDEIEYGLGSVYPMPGGLKENVYWLLGSDVFIRQMAASTEEISASTSIIQDTMAAVHEEMDALVKAGE